MMPKLLASYVLSFRGTKEHARRRRTYTECSILGRGRRSERSLRTAESALAQFTVHISNPSLRVSIEFLKRYSNALPVGVPDIITSHKRSERYRLRRRKRGVPPGAMLGAGHLSAEFAFIGSRNLMPHELLFGVRMLTFAQSRKVLRLNCAAELPLLREAALPLAMAFADRGSSSFVSLSKLTLVIGSRLAGRQRL